MLNHALARATSARRELGYLSESSPTFQYARDLLIELTAMCRDRLTGDRIIPLNSLMEVSNELDAAVLNCLKERGSRKGSEHDTMWCNNDPAYLIWKAKQKLIQKEKNENIQNKGSRSTATRNKQH